MIDGVSSRQLRVISDERGWLMEVLRSDWTIFKTFTQVYVTAAYPHVVKAWHMHKKQTDNIACIDGMVKLVLYDGRKRSKTAEEFNEFFIGTKAPLLVSIPPQIWHGFKAIGEKTALVINMPTKLYDYENPDEYRLPPDTKDIKYDWKLAPGLKHG